MGARWESLTLNRAPIHFPGLRKFSKIFPPIKSHPKNLIVHLGTHIRCHTSMQNVFLRSGEVWGSREVWALYRPKTKKSTSSPPQATPAHPHYPKQCPNTPRTYLERMGFQKFWVKKIIFGGPKKMYGERRRSEKTKIPLFNFSHTLTDPIVDPQTRNWQALGP